MVVVTPVQTRTKRRRARSFENLVQAGLAVIGKRGLYETTVEHITEAADVGKGTFYAHFASKDDLIYHLVRHGFDELIAATASVASVNGTPAARLADLIQAQLQALGRRKDLLILLHQVRGLLILQPKARHRLRREYRRYIAFLMEECHRVLRRAGRTCIVALSKKRGWMVRLYEAAHAKLPNVLDCRPIYVRQAIEGAGFRVLEARETSMWGLPIETILAIKESP